jgi:hypothetical protein
LILLRQNAHNYFEIVLIHNNDFSIFNRERDNQMHVLQYDSTDNIH